MKPHDLEELILDLVGPGEASPFEIAGELCDVSPGTRTRELIVKLIYDGRLEVTRDFNVRIPRVAVVPNPEDGQ